MGICTSQSNKKQQKEREKLKIVLPNKQLQESPPEPLILNQSKKEQSPQNSQPSQKSLHTPGIINENQRQSIQSYGVNKKSKQIIGNNQRSPSMRSLSQRSLSNCSSPIRGSVIQGVQFYSTNASKKYSFMHNKEMQINVSKLQKYSQQELSFVQNNKTGKKARLEILSKAEEESIKFIYWLKSNQLDHKNILKNLEVHQDNTTYQLIYEYFDGCSLSKLSTQIEITETILGNIAIQLFSVLDYFKTQQLIHGNITLHSWEYQFQSDEVIIKLIDLQPISVKKVDELDVLLYTPPDALYKREYLASRDLWAIMMILYSLGKGDVPYKIPHKLLNDIPSVKQFILNHQFDVEQDLRKWSAEFRYFVQSVIGEKNKKRRKPYEELKNNEWIKKYRQDEIAIQEKFLQNMMNQKESCQLQQTILEIMVQELEQETAFQLQKLFSEFDQDLDLKLTKEELIKMFKKYTKLTDLEFRINQLFIDHQITSDFMTQFTFLSLAAPKESLLTKANLETTFNLLSNNKTELRAINITKYLNLINEDLETQFNELAQEKKLTLEQFIRVMELVK